MKYLLLIYNEEARWTGLSEADRKALAAEYGVFSERLRKEGHGRDAQLMQVTYVSPVGQAGFCVFCTGHRSRLLPISVLLVLDGRQDLVEDVKDPVHLGLDDRERRLDLQDVAETGVPGGAEDDTLVHRPPVHLQRLGGGGLPGLLIADEFDADEQARPADVTDKRVPRLHLVQGVRGVPAHIGAGLQQAVSAEDFQGRQSGGQADQQGGSRDS